MFKLVRNFKTLNLHLPETFSPTCTTRNLNTIRSRKKPLHFPTAKSKIFVVKPRIRLPPDEAAELKRLWNNYRTAIKSVNKFFEDEYKSQSMIQFDEELHKKILEEDFLACSKVNEEWNNKVKLVREARVEEELQLKLEKAREMLEKSIEEQTKLRAEADQIVKETIAASDSFITPDKLDAAIEYAMNNPVDYNFALEVDGTKIFGRETAPPSKQAVEKSNIVATQ